MTLAAGNAVCVASVTHFAVAPVVWMHMVELLVVGWTGLVVPSVHDCLMAWSGGNATVTWVTVWMAGRACACAKLKVLPPTTTLLAV